MQSQRHVSTDATYCMHLSTWSIWFVSSLLHVTFPAQSFQHSCSWFVPLPLKMPDLLRLLQRFAFRPKVHRTGQQKLTCWPVANLESWDLQCYWSFCKKGSLPLIPPLHTQRSPTKLQNHFIFAFAPRWVLLFCSMVASWPTLDLVGYLVIRMSGKHLFFLGTVALWLDLIALLSLNLGWTCSVLGTARQRRSDLCAKCNLSYSLSEAPKDNLLTNPTLIEVGCSKLGGMAAIWPCIIFPSMYMLDWLLAELSTLTGAFKLRVGQEAVIICHIWGLWRQHILLERALLKFSAL